MKLLLLCESYPPAIGGVAEVMRQVAERLAARGHEVTVASSAHPARDFTELNGVRICAFAVSGNAALGMRGEVGAYRDFVRNWEGDAILAKAAQQWSFDAAMDLLPAHDAATVFIPCGYAGLRDPRYRGYYRALRNVLPGFDRLVFYGRECRDAELAEPWGITRYDIVPNGAGEEFETAEAGDIRARLGIAGDAFLFLTVGGLTGLKGQEALAEAFARMETGGRRAALLMVGNLPQLDGRRGVRGILSRLKHRLLLARVAGFARAARSDPGKQVAMADLSRQDVLRAYAAADLFVLASRTEYSPLVLYEAAASGTPFISTPAGNAAEIARETGAGAICPALEDARGHLRASTRLLAAMMREAMDDPERLRAMGEAGRTAWRTRFTWEAIAGQYEAALMQAVSDKRARREAA